MSENVIIGASSGIGKAISEKFISDSQKVYSFSRTSPGIAEVEHFTYDALSSDFTVFNNLPERIDSLCYCPGSINLKPFSRMTKTDFENDFDLNVMGAIQVIQQLLPRLKKAENASVLLFSTVAVQTGMSFHSSIAASKGAVEGLTRALAAEFASSGIRFNCIAPSLTDTPLATNLLSSPEKRESAGKRHPLGRVGTPEDLAEAAFFLLSPKSSWITGQIIHVDGGMGDLK